jgi:hypothetical protein
VWWKFPLFEYNKRSIRVVLIRIHDESFWINGAHVIPKEKIRYVTSLRSFEPVIERNFVKVNELIERISATLEGKEVILKKIVNPTIWYATRFIGHKF